MSTRPQIGSKGYRRTPAYGFAILAVMITLGVVRLTPPSFAQILHAHATTGWNASHHQRLSLERQATDWITPSDIYLATPSLPTSPVCTVLIDLLLPLSTEGAHYNRPPPVA